MANVSFDFTGANVFVAGGTSGINLGIARGFAQAGARVGVLSRNPEKVEAARRLLTEAGRHQALGYAADVRNPVAVSEAIATFAAEAGPIDCLVSGAAGNFRALAANLSPNGFRTVIDIDLNGTFHVMKAAYPHLRRPGSSIINISAPQATLATEAQIHACAAKAGIDQVTRTLALEWGPEGIRVNSISPGFISGTEGLARLGPDGDEHQAAAKLSRVIAMRRLGDVTDIADSAMFLASDAARYVSGVVLTVDGGAGMTGMARAMYEPGN